MDSLPMLAFRFTTRSARVPEGAEKYIFISAERAEMKMFYPQREETTK